MCKYITRTAFIILFLSLTSCETCNQKPPIFQDIQEKQPTNQEEELKSEIKELELQRKQHIAKLMDEWEGNKSLSSFETLLKQGDIEEIYKYKIEGMHKRNKKINTEADIEGYLNQLRDNAKNKNKDYSFTKEEIAILEKDLYKLYESYFSDVYIKKNKKQGVDKYFKKLEDKEKNGSLKNSGQKKLQLLRNWKLAEPILKLEQEKREALKKLQETKKS
jgi:hypothetical protein